jgi:hypothetical protein
MERVYAPYTSHTGAQYRRPPPLPSASRQVEESDTEEEEEDYYESDSGSYTSDSDSGSSSEDEEGFQGLYTKEGYQDLLPDPLTLATAPMVLANTMPSSVDNPETSYADVTTSGALDQANQFTTFKTTNTSQTSLISINSGDRDHNVFPQPTNFTLYLPKIYRNVTTFQFTQIKLLSAFFYFRNSKYNTWFDVAEEGRRNAAGTQLVHRVQIREGSYDINGLLGELMIQMNTTPTFFYYPNGFADFVPLFSTTGDFAYVFNKPGDYYYDSALNKYVPNPTLLYIITRYFPSRYGGLTSYTLNQMLVAYYYPVLKEAFLEPTIPADLNINLTGYAVHEIYDRVVYNYGGLDDPVILALINQNLKALDAYRTDHTFYDSLINKYIWGLDTMTNKVYVNSSNLNTSIVADITAQSNIILSNTLAYDYGLTLAQYQNLSNVIQSNSLLVNSLLNYYQIGLANYYGVNYGSYTLDQLVNPSTLMYLQNGSNVSGVYNAYTLPYIQARGAGQIQDLPDFNTAPSSLVTTWSNYISTAPTFNFSTLNQSDRGVPYEYSLSNFLDTTPMVNNSSILYTNPKKQSLNVLTHISAGQYSLFRFRSDVRQTLQVETIHKPFFYRYPEYMYAFGNNLPTLFNKSYTWSPSPFSNAGQVIQDWGTVPFGLNLQSSVSQFFSTAYLLKSSNNTYYYKFTAPPPNVMNPSAITYKYPMNIVLWASTISTFTTPVNVALYQDDAGFYADSANGSEQIYNYCKFDQTNVSTNVGGVTFDVITGNTYYVTIRVPTTSFGDIPYFFSAYTGNSPTVIPLENPPIPVTSLNNPAFFDPVANLSSNPQNINFNKTNDPAWTHLNAASTLMLRDPSFQGFNVVYPSAAPVLGYDDNNISTDFTDYKGWVDSQLSNAPYAQYRKDPLNSVQLISNSPYNVSAQQYFYSGSSNSLQSSNGNLPYTPQFSTVTKREYKIVHWYDDTYIAPQTFDGAYSTLSGMSSLSTRVPYNQSTLNVGGYTYVADSNYGGLSTLQLGYGVSGFSFLPTNGSWDCDRFAFKSAYTGTDSPNTQIAYVGIFDTLSVKDQDKSAVCLCDAIAILSSSRTAVYSSFTQAALNDGFDPSLGSYYEYVRLPWQTNGTAYRRHDKASAGLAGYTQLPCTIITREEAYYSVLPFKADGTLTTFFMPTGSTVPYPDNSVPFLSTNYLGSNVPTDAGPRQAVIPSTSVAVLSNYVYNLYSSKYEQSLPINGQLVHYQEDLDVLKQANGMKYYNPWHGMVADTSLILKSGNYRIGADRYLLFAPPVLNFESPASNSYEYVSTPRYVTGGDAYQVRNAGQDGRDTVWVNSFDFAGLAPAGEQVVQWSATSNTPYILTVSTGNQTMKVYPVSGELSNDIFTLGPLMTSFQPYISTATFTDTLNVSSAQFGITATSNFYYTDLAGSTSSMRGVLIHNMSAGVSLFGGFFVSSADFLDITANVGEVQHHTLLKYAPISSTKILEGNFTVSGAGYNGGVGMNLGQLNLSNLILPAQYGSNAFSVRSDSLTNCQLFTSNFTDRWVGITKDPAILPVGSNLDVYVSAKTPTYYNPSNNFANVSWIIGDDDSYWIKVIADSYFSQDPWLIYGNTRTGGDLGYALKTAWQIFYPTMKVTLTKRANKYNDITNTVDTNYFSNYGDFYTTPANYPEYGHTNMFFYSNYNSLMSDLSTVSAMTTLYKWGQESNYYKADTEFQGYGFNSYIYNITLQPSGPITGSNSYYYLAVRGYAPTEDFQTMVRFSLTNRYDYGFISANDLQNEISVINTGNVTNYNPEYVASTAAFDAYFSTNTVAMNIFVNPTLTFTGFSSFYSTFSAYYTAYNSTLITYSSIQSTLTSKLQSYLLQYYGPIMPTDYFSRAKFTDSIRFDLLFKSSIYTTLSNADQFWGLGYNLGFPKADMSNNTPATPEGTTPIVGQGTYYNADSFYKILDDYIYLRLNDEYSLNRVDTSGPEDLALVQETNGATKQYYAKLLLANFGSYTQSMIQNPVALNPPIAKIDRIRFQWIDQLGNVIDNGDCEWSGILQITESLNIVSPDTTIERPPPVA